MILVGSTGFVGSNLMKQGVFDRVYHSIDIEDAYETHPDILIYAGVTGTKFWANKFPDKDRIVIEQAIKNIERIGARKLALLICLSTDVLYSVEMCSALIASPAINVPRI